MLNDDFKNWWITEDIFAQIVVLNIVFRQFILDVSTFDVSTETIDTFECLTKDFTD